MAAFAFRPLFVVLLVLAFYCQTLATAAMHCKGETARVTEASTANSAMDMHQHHHDATPAAKTSATHAHADCCTTNGQCLMACALALASIDLPPPVKMPVPLIDSYSGFAPTAVTSSPYKPPILG